MQAANGAPPFTTMYVAASTGVPEGNEGVASAMAMTAQQLGGSVGLALLVGLLTERVTALGGTTVGSSIQPASAATSALHVVFAVQGIIAILGAATALFVMGEGGAEGLAWASAMPKMEIERTRRTGNDLHPVSRSHNSTTSRFRSLVPGE